jgi:hypothetical protein
VRDHAIVSPRFWTGETGKRLRKHPDAQRLALYLITCPSSNMIGLYYLPIPTICHELNLPFKGASEGLRRVFEGGFAAYDEVSETIFVYEMARFQIGETLGFKDNRIKMVERQLETVRKSKFYNDFLKKYGSVYKLKNLTPFEGASDPLRSQDQDQDQEQGIKDPPNPPAGGTSGASVQKPKPPRKSSLADHPLFAGFWEVYPRKTARQKAADAFAKIDPDDALLKAMLAAVDAQKRSEQWTKDHGNFIPHPATWLNGRRWEDQPPEKLIAPPKGGSRTAIYDDPNSIPKPPRPTPAQEKPNESR